MEQEWTRTGSGSGPELDKKLPLRHIFLPRQTEAVLQCCGGRMGSATIAELVPENHDAPSVL